jgi:hypothetical protein
MLETTDTNNGLAVGHYKFTISSPVEKRKFEGKESKYYLFKLMATVDGNLLEHQERIPVWMAGEILRALECKEVKPGVFEWDKEAVVGEMIEGDIVIEKSKDGTKEYRRLKNIKQALPF